ncbi:MAG: TonB-dependent receptor [Prevotella sp.]|nr:TonB-dependent receptor [Prevotella sp.]
MKQQISRRLLISLSFIICHLSFSIAQNAPIRGQVLDEHGDPIIGATIRVAGQTTGGAVTDLDGNYQLQVPANTRVTVTYIGYLPQTVQVGTTVRMMEDRQSLEEVVVVGYGTQKMKNVTGAVETITPKDIEDLSVGSLGDALVGMFNGVSVTRGAGQNRPGQSPSLTIRQSDIATSVTPNSTRGGEPDPSPLYVIDGFISTEGQFNNLDISEVESITVLKDASAAVYGARAAYGVVLVKTKQGTNAAPKISYSGQFGWTDALYTPKMMSAQDYMRTYNTMRAANTSTQDNIEMRTQLFQLDEINAVRDVNYNLLDQEWSAALTHRHNLNINGGNDKATYFAGVSYYNQDGNIGRLDYDRWNFRAGINANIGEWVKSSLQVSGDWGERNNSVSPSGGGTDFDYRWLMTHLPFVPDYADGYPIVYSGMENTIPTSATRLYNFPAVQNSSDNVLNRSNNLSINGSIELNLGFIKPLQGLSAKVSYSKNVGNSQTNTVSTILDLYRLTQRGGSGSHLYTGNGVVYDENTTGVLRLVSNGGMLRRTMARSDSYQYNFTLQYARTFQQKHDVSALFSIEKTEAWSEDLLGNVTDLIAYQDGQSSSSMGDQTTSFGRSESGMLSYVGRFNYAYASKYLFEFLFRADASTKFAPKNYWGKFPSISAGWVISEEEWFQNSVKWIDFLKLRASWGLMGRDNIRAWLWTQLYNRDAAKGAIFGSNGINSNVGYALVIPKAGTNSDVHWDKTYKTNFGVDARFLQSRLSVDFNFYYDRGRELFATRTGTADFPTTVGTQATPENYGEIDYWGWELNLGWRDKIGQDINYWVKLSTGYSDNKILATNFQAIPEYDDQVYGERADRGLWGFKCLGMFRSYQEIEEYFAKYNISEYMGMTKSEVRPGMLIYEDIQGDNNGDGTYAPADGKVTAGNDYIRLSERTSNPYGFTVNLGGSWKNLSLQAQFAASWGSKALIGTDYRQAAGDYEYENMPTSFRNMFNYSDIYDAQGNVTVPRNVDASMPNMRYSNVNQAASSFWLVDNKQVTLRNVTLAYQLPKSIIKPIGIQGVKLNLTVQNAINFFNPYPDKSWASYGGTYTRYPSLRKITMGVNVSF